MVCSGMNKISWFGTVASILGSFIVAFKMFILGYCLFLTGSILWLIIGVYRKDKSLITLNCFFLLANIVGLYNAI